MNPSVSRYSVSLLSISFKIRFDAGCEILSHTFRASLQYADDEGGDDNDGDSGEDDRDELY